MGTPFLAAADAVVAALAAAPALAGGRIKRGRDVPMSQRDVSGIAVDLVASVGTDLGIGRKVIDWQTLISVSLYARATAAADGVQAIDGLLAAAWTRLRAMPLPAGCKTAVIDPHIDWEVEDLDQTLCCARIKVQLRHFSDAELEPA